MGWVRLSYIFWKLPVGGGGGTHCIHACTLEDEARIKIRCKNRYIHYIYIIYYILYIIYYRE